MSTSIRLRNFDYSELRCSYLNREDFSDCERNYDAIAISSYQGIDRTPACAMAWSDHRKTKIADVFYRFRNNLLVATRQVKAAYNGMKGNRRKCRPSVLKNIDQASV